MRPILLPTDFSDSSKNALRYGFQLAKVLKTEVLLFHANHIPVIAPNTPVGVYDNIITLEEERQKQSLEELRTELYRETGISEMEVPCTTILSLGFAVDEILNISEQKEAGLIVMGTQGASGITKALIGSNAASVIKKAKIPVLSIPSHSTFSEIKKIILATDFQNTQKKTFEPLIEIALLFGSEIIIFNVRKEVVPTENETIAGLEIEETFKRVEHRYNFMENKNVLKGIEDFAKNEKPDVLAMVSHKQNFFESLFRTSFTEEIAMDALVPLLTIPEV